MTALYNDRRSLPLNSALDALFSDNTIIFNNKTYTVPLLWGWKFISSGDTLCEDLFCEGSFVKAVCGGSYVRENCEGSSVR